MVKLLLYLVFYRKWNHLKCKTKLWKNNSYNICLTFSFALEKQEDFKKSGSKNSKSLWKIKEFFEGSVETDDLKNTYLSIQLNV